MVQDGKVPWGPWDPWDCWDRGFCNLRILHGLLESEFPLSAINNLPT
jgi:hypothetical protein